MPALTTIRWMLLIEREGDEMRLAMLRILCMTVIGLASLVPLDGRAETQSRTGLEPTLPILPVIPPRALESDEAEFSREARGPIAEFLESVTTSDAVIEVIVGQGRIITTKAPIAQEGGIALVAAGDPTVFDFEVAGPRLLRILGTRVGQTDMSITTDAGETYTIDVHVVYDLPLVKAYLLQTFPDALIELKQLREHIILSGQARSVEQISQIVLTLQSYLRSAQVARQVESRTSRRGEVPLEGAPGEQPVPGEEPFPAGEPAGPTPIEVPEERPRTRGTFVGPQIINLMRVPGVQQVMLKVQIAELNRTALRQIGADMFLADGRTVLGTNMAGAKFNLEQVNQMTGFLQRIGVTAGTTTTAFGIFDNGDFQIFLSALRANGVSNILAEPNLIAMNGQEASFLAGGEIPVPVPQAIGTGAITIEYKEFGVLLNFVPTILDDETIRLRVAPEVSSLDFVNAVVIAGQVTPALQTRNVNTTVELKQGQTLALAGLLQVELRADTARIPGLGDLPYLGPLFSNTRHERVEKELLVMVTPYLVSPLDCGQTPPLPGSEILDPNDCEFYFLNRLEGRTGTPFRATTSWDDPLGCRYRMELEHRQFCGPVGYSE